MKVFLPYLFLTLQGFRKSLKGGGNDRQGSTIIGNGVISPKSSMTIEPPKKVIRAIRDYSPRSPRELAFLKGDFFHVVAGENNRDYYEACNPATNQRGLVPVSFFETIGKTVGANTSTLTSQISAMGLTDNSPRAATGYGYPSNGVPSPGAGDAPAKPKPATPVYGVVQYDFIAEQKDELNVKAGESIIVIAQSNHEWFVCKPIGRLGGPGLIPISFIEIRDVATGKPVENIEEFVAKSGVPKVEEWKQKLGEYKSKSIPLGQFEFSNSNVSPGPTPPPAVQQLARQSSINNGSGYSPLNSPTAALAVKDARIEQFSYTNGRYWYWVRAVMEDGRHRNLCRYYEDFYNFQLTLLATFPVESGSTGRQRILPFIPGPTQYVTDAIAEERKDDLDLYVRELCLLPVHIKNHELVKNFFTPREGDVESSRATNMAPNPTMARESSFSGGRTSQTSTNRVSNHTQGSSDSRSSSQHHIRTQPLSRSGSSPTATTTITPINMLKSQTQPTSTTRHASESHESGYSSSPVSQRQASTTAPPFIKIKIFFQDDIIVIRTPPDVTYDHLIDKMTERLGKPFHSVRYRDSMSGELMDITNDGDLSAALQASEKLVLIAD
jgi:bud emergence protein 1